MSTISPAKPAGPCAAIAFPQRATESDLRLVYRGLVYRALFGFFLLIIFTASHLIPIGSPDDDVPNFICAALLIAVNGAYYLYLRNRPEGIVYYRYTALFVDLIFITVLTYYLGGANAFYAFPFYSLIILYSATIFARPWHFVVAGLSSLALIGLFLGDNFELLQPVQKMMDLDLAPMQQVVVVASASLFFFFTAFLSGMLSDSLLARTRDLAEANAMIEAQNIKLESRIADRTREIAAQNVLLQRQNERIVEANRLKTEYLLNINHELRTPLTSILGYGRMLLDRQIEPERQREFVKSMVAQANVLNSFVSSLNQIEDIESGVTMLQRSQIRLSDLIDEAIITLRPRFEERGLKIPPCLSDGPDLAASVDPEKIRQVLLNLLENALRVTPRGGRIAISIERSEDQLRVGVHDNGPGIHAEYLECVFERFKQLDESYSRLRGGLGLGLSLVRSIVELHGGKSWAESPGRLSQDAEEGNRGASFYFTIPVKAPAEKGTESASV